MSPAIWSLQVCTDPMANVLTVCLPFLGQGGEYWDTTCPDTLAPSYTYSFATREAGAVTEEAERKKSARYSHLERSHYFVPIAVEIFGAFGPEVHSFCETLVIVLFLLLKILFLIFILNSKSLWLCRGVIWFQSGDLLLRFLWRTPILVLVIDFSFVFCFSFQIFFISVLFCFSLSRSVYHSAFHSYL